MTKSQFIIDLAREQAMRELAAIHSLFPTIIEAFLANAGDPRFNGPRKKKRKYVRKVKATSRKTTRRKITRKRTGPKVRDVVMAILQHSDHPVLFKDMTRAAFKRGWQTESQDPKTVVSVTLQKLVKDGKVEAIGPRPYTYIAKRA